MFGSTWIATKFIKVEWHVSHTCSSPLGHILMRANDDWLFQSLPHAKLAGEKLAAKKLAAEKLEAEVSR